jgi:dihydropyrimidine dehydrogenase (NAD+) subunit PreA
MKASSHFELVDVLFPLRDLRVEFCGFELDNPFILAAGPTTDDPERVARAFQMGWAGAVLKTTSPPGTRVDLVYPLIARGRGSEIGNIDLISPHAVDEVEQWVRDLKRRFPRKLVAASMMAASKEGWQSVSRRLARAGADLIECSFSCPQGSLGDEPGRMLAQSAEATALVAGWVKEAADGVPVSIKITPLVTDVAQIAEAAQKGGADAVTASNSLPCLLGVDTEQMVGMPDVRGATTYSGLSGETIRALSLRVVADVARAVRIPVSGTGGVANCRDAVEFMALGAHTVQVCTAVMRWGLGIVREMRRGLSCYLEERMIDSVGDIVGAAVESVVEHNRLKRVKVVMRFDEHRCIACGLCYRACTDAGHNAVEFDVDRRLVRIDEEGCLGCGLCSAICPVEGCLWLEQAEQP